MNPTWTITGVLFLLAVMVWSIAKLFDSERREKQFRQDEERLRRQEDRIARQIVSEVQILNSTEICVEEIYEYLEGRP